MKEPMDKQFDVFLSYNRHDESWVKRLKSALEERDLRVWRDVDATPSGGRWAEAIERGLETSAAVALVVSPESVSSKWVGQEYYSALDLSNKPGSELPIIPLLLRTAELPLFLKTRQLIDFRDEAMFDVGVEKLLAALRPLRRLRKACFISSEYPPSIVGGLGRHVQNLTTALASRMNVDVVLPRPEDKTQTYQELAKNVRTVTVPVDASYGDKGSWCRFARNAIQEVTNWAKSERPDVIHCHDWVTVLAGIKCRWALDIPLVFHVHLPNREPLCASIENLGLVSADMVTVSSKAMQVEMQDRRMPIRNLKVVKNGVDLAVFQPARDWRADGGYILIAGRLVEQKGVEYLIRAFNYVRKRFGVRLKIVGHGEYEEWLKRLSINLTLSPYVDFEPWVQKHEELAGLYQQALLVAVPSVFEPFGMVALEAMACKRVVVASRLGGLEEIVQHGKTGFLVEPKDHLDLAQWIMTLLSDNELRNRMGEAGYERVTAEGCTWPNIAEQVSNLYLEVRAGFEIGSKPAAADQYIDQILGQAAAEDKRDWEHLLSNLFNKVPL